MIGIKRIEVVPVYESRYGTLFDDRVEGPTGARGRYLRWEWAQPGLVVVPRDGSRVGLAQMHRYSIDAESIEFPRGSRKHGESIDAAAARELLEETGCVALSLVVVGEVHPESGLLAARLPVVEARVSGRAGSPSPDAMEAITPEVIWVERERFWAMVKAGEIRCAITIAAMALVD